MTKKQKKNFLIGLDLGTSAIKGIIMNQDGKILAEETRETVFIHPKEGWIELDPEAHYRDVCGVIRKLAEAAPDRVTAVSMAAASGNTMLCSDGGSPVSNIISWMDQRGGDKEGKLKGLTAAEVWQITGWPCVDIFPLAHLAWFRKNQHELYAKAGKYCMNTDWLLYRLTGNWIMDHSTATTFHLQDQSGKCWHKPFLKMLEIPEGKLSNLADPGVSAGNLTAQGASDTGLSINTKIITGCFDHPAAARAAGIFEPGQLMLSCGTSWVGFFPEKERQKVVDLELLCDPFMSFRNGPWGAIFSVPYIGRTVDDYINMHIAPGDPDKYQVFNDSAAEARPGAGGLRIDLREPVSQRMDAERKNISRAVMEGAAGLLKEKLDNLKKHGFNFRKAVMTGGPSRSTTWLRIIGEITGVEVTQGSRHAGAKGAAILAGIGAGLYRDEYEAYKKTI